MLQLKILETATMNFKKANQCDSLEELRGEIDKIDYEIIQLFSERMKYVEAVVDFKSDEESIIASERKERVLKERSEWALKNDLDPKVFRKIYSILIESNIQHEMMLLNGQKNR